MIKKSVINWQTGEPEKCGSYLVSVNSSCSVFVTTDYWNGLKAKWQYWDENVVAWCKLSDIEPYKEEEV